MTVTGISGTLMWGQAGEYPGAFDRDVITVLADRRVGVMRAPAFAAQSGMDVNMSPWSAVIACGDDTTAVAASHSPRTLTFPAGPSSGSRKDVVWCDVDPNAATWWIELLAEHEIVNRTGIRLGTGTIPAGANLASQCTFAGVPLSAQMISHRGVNEGNLGVLDRTRSIQMYVSPYWPHTDGQSGFNIDLTNTPGTWDYDARGQQIEPSCVVGGICHPYEGQASNLGGIVEPSVWYMGRLVAEQSSLTNLRFRVANAITGAAVPGRRVALLIVIYYQPKIN